MEIETINGFFKTVFNLCNNSLLDHYLNLFSDTIAFDEQSSHDENDEEHGTTITYVIFSDDPKNSFHTHLVDPIFYNSLLENQPRSNTVYKYIRNMNVTAITGTTPPNELKILISIDTPQCNGLINGEFLIRRNNAKCDWRFLEAVKFELLSTANEDDIQLALNGFVIENLKSALG